MIIRIPPAGNFVRLGTSAPVARMALDDKL
jgi:hypothetical protein